MYTPSQRLLRSRSDRLIAGVAGGIAQYLAIDPVLVRLAFIALCFTGPGILLYPLLWLIMPTEGGQGSAPSQAFDEVRQRAARMGEEIREVFVAPGSAPRRPRYDPMTGAPIDPDAEIPINNVGAGATPSPDTPARRHQLLGLILLGIGALLLLNMLLGPAFGKLLIPLLLVGVGVAFLRRRA